MDIFLYLSVHGVASRSLAQGHRPRASIREAADFLVGGYAVRLLHAGAECRHLGSLAVGVAEGSTRKVVDVPLVPDEVNLALRVSMGIYFAAFAF